MTNFSSTPKCIFWLPTVDYVFHNLETFCFVLFIV